MEAWGKVPAKYGRLPFKTKSEKEAVKDLIDDCEIHHHIDGSMLSSAAHFYEFMYTEVKFHADCWGLDFEKARKAFEAWAKKTPKGFSQT